MESEELISEGLNLMLLGMGTVFVFLTILVFVTSFMSALVQKYAPVEPTEAKAPATIGAVEDQTLIAVISAAVHAHRSKK